MSGHTHRLAVVVGSTPPVESIIDYGPEPDMPHDSGFTVLLSDAPHADELTGPGDRRVSTRCLLCLIEQHPEAARGLDLAREHGVAERDPATGEWSGHELE